MPKHKLKILKREYWNQLGDHQENHEYFHWRKWAVFDRFGSLGICLNSDEVRSLAIQRLWLEFTIAFRNFWFFHHFACWGIIQCWRQLCRSNLGHNSRQRAEACCLITTRYTGDFHGFRWLGSLFTFALLWQGFLQSIPEDSSHRSTGIAGDRLRFTYFCHWEGTYSGNLMAAGIQDAAWI